MRYLQRSIKYFLSVCVVYGAILYFFSLTTNMVLTPGQKFHAMISTERGLFLIGALLLLSAVYPYFGYMRRFISGDIVADRDTIIAVFRSQHMKLDHESEGRMTFIHENLFRRCTMMFEDHVKVVRCSDGRLSVTGNRKMVAYVMYRLEVAMNATSEKK